MDGDTNSAVVAPNVIEKEGQGRRRRRRRKSNERRRKITNKKENITIVLSNCKGYTSKSESIKQDIVENKAPDVLLLNETLLKGDRKVKVKN